VGDDAIRKWLIRFGIEADREQVAATRYDAAPESCAVGNAPDETVGPQWLSAKSGEDRYWRLAQQLDGAVRTPAAALELLHPLLNRPFDQRPFLGEENGILDVTEDRMSCDPIGKKCLDHPGEPSWEIVG
jgi:hypothetical protein